MTTIPKGFARGLMILLVAAFVACSGDTEENTQEETTMAEADTAAAPEAKLNLNTASGEEFRTIPNVGDNMVHEFEEYRPYVSIQQFRKEIAKYVSDEQVSAYENYVYVPVHRNDSDRATLLQIPGLDRQEADSLIAGRPYEDNQSFFEALSSYIGEEQMSTAKVYIKAE